MDIGFSAGIELAVTNIYAQLLTMNALHYLDKQYELGFMDKDEYLIRMHKMIFTVINEKEGGGSNGSL